MVSHMKIKDGRWVVGIRADTKQGKRSWLVRGGPVRYLGLSVVPQAKVPH